MWQSGGSLFFPQSQFGNPFSFSSMNQPGFPTYMQGWGAVGAGLDLFQQQQQQQQTQQNVTPALPTAPPAQQPPVPIIPQTFSIAPTPTPPPIPVQPPLPGVPPTVPPPVIPDLSKPPPADVLPPGPPPASVVDMTVPPPTFGAGNTPGGMSPDPPPPGTEIALPISLPPPLPKVETPPAAPHSFLSPRLLAEAMIESPQSKLSKKEAKRAARMQEEQQNRRFEGARTESTVSRNLHFGQDAKENEPVEVKAKQPQAESEGEQAKVSASSQAAVKQDGEKSDQEDDTKEGRRQYKFAWDKKAEDEMSDITISSVHTSDLSSFSDGERSSDGQVSEKEEGRSQVSLCLCEFSHSSVLFVCVLLLLLLLLLFFHKIPLRI